MTQMYSFAQSSSSSLESPSQLEVPPPVAKSLISHAQFATHDPIDPLHTPVITPPPSYKPRHSSDVSPDLEAGISPKATSKQATAQPRYSCCHFLAETWTVLVSLAFIVLVCTILMFFVGTALTDIGARLLAWDNHAEFLVLLTWPYTLAAIALGSAILGSVFALVLFLLGMHSPDAIMDARLGFVLPPCALGSVFALPVGLAAFPTRSGVVPDMPLTWKDALNASAAGVIGLSGFVVVCILALLAGGMLVGTIPLRRVSAGRAKDVSRSSSSGCAV
ncbi:hypothetical protein V8D89_010419 [Ganoderma adspersum]